jgi:hypothetical protein
MRSSNAINLCDHVTRPMSALANHPPYCTVSETAVAVCCVPLALPATVTM